MGHLLPSEFRQTVFLNFRCSYPGTACWLVLIVVGLCGGASCTIAVVQNSRNFDA